MAVILVGSTRNSQVDIVMMPRVDFKCKKGMSNFGKNLSLYMDVFFRVKNKGSPIGLKLYVGQGPTPYKYGFQFEADR